MSFILGITWISLYLLLSILGVRTLHAKTHSKGIHTHDMQQAIAIKKGFIRHFLSDLITIPYVKSTYSQVICQKHYFQIINSYPDNYYI